MSSIVPGFEGLTGEAEALFNRVVYSGQLLRHLGDAGLGASNLPYIGAWLNEQVGDAMPDRLTAAQMIDPSTRHFVQTLLEDHEEKDIIACNNSENSGRVEFLDPIEYVLALSIFDRSVSPDTVAEVGRYISQSGLLDEIAHAEFVQSLTQGGQNV
mgnify:CR=1 FL=1